MEHDFWFSVNLLLGLANICDVLNPATSTWASNALYFSYCPYLSTVYKELLHNWMVLTSLGPLNKHSTACCTYLLVRILVFGMRRHEWKTVDRNTVLAFVWATAFFGIRLSFMSYVHTAIQSSVSLFSLIKILCVVLNAISSVLFVGSLIPSLLPSCLLTTTHDKAKHVVIFVVVIAATQTQKHLSHRF